MMVPTHRNGLTTAGHRGTFVDRWISEAFNDVGQLFNAWDQTLTPLRGMDVYQQGGQLAYDIELPGLRKDDLRVRLEGGHLVVSGQFQTGGDGENRRYLSRGRRQGTFQRAFVLPENVIETNGKSLEAQFEHGVLRVRLPLREELQPKPIDIKVK